MKYILLGWIEWEYSSEELKATTLNEAVAEAVGIFVDRKGDAESAVVLEVNNEVCVGPAVAAAREAQKAEAERAKLEEQERAERAEYERLSRKFGGQPWAHRRRNGKP